jgi:membrane-bound inhibitor of C-type lysozyme
MRRTWLYVTALSVILFIFMESDIRADSPKANVTQAKILQSWHGDYPVAKLSLLPEKQRNKAVGYIQDAKTFEIVWKTFKPDEPVPTVDLRKHIVLFTRNTQYYNRISIGKVNVTDGVGELLAMETMSAIPIEDKVAMSMVLVSREGIDSISTPDGLVHIPRMPVPRTYVYECSDGYTFPARIEGRDAWLFLPEQTVKLPGVPSASGAKYSDGSSLFRTKGEEAFLETGGKRHSACQNNRAKAIWEDAKLSGVSFRAVGNEPGWHLEITPSEKTVFVTDYGELQHSVVTAQLVTEQNTRTTTYDVGNAEHDLTVEIQGQSCEDTMSGETFEATVTVKLDGKTYKGCGKALH